MFRSTAHLKIMRRFAASALSLTVGRQMYEITIKRLIGEEAQERRASARHTQRKNFWGTNDVTKEMPGITGMLVLPGTQSLPETRACGSAQCDALLSGRP